MIILGLDPGTARTGFGIIETNGKRTQCINYGCITTDKSLSLAERLYEIGHDLDDIIEKFKPDFAAVEELFFCSNITTAIHVSHARGVIVEHLFKAKVPITGFTPLQVKQSLTGYGRAQKSQIQEMVKSLLRLDDIPKPDDAADALAIALTYSFTNFELKAGRSSNYHRHPK
jgi:crossover junction endodeoxyribonuclease RuvC